MLSQLTSVFNQLDVKQQHREARTLAVELLGDDLDTGGITPLEPDFRLALLAFGKFSGQQIMAVWANKYRHARTDETRAQCLPEWHWEQRMFDLINDAVSKRYKVNLENRSFAEGASKEGKTLEEFRKNRPLRQEYLG